MQILKKITLLAVFMLAFGICASAQVTVTGSTGANNTYPTLKDAFDAVNAGDQTGNNISVAITASTTETASAVLNAGLWTSLTIRPTVAATVSGNIVGAIIKLNSADNVTIDGRIGGTGSGRSLTVANTSALGSTAAIWLASGTAAGSGAINNVIRNLELAGGAAQDSLTVSTFGIIMSGTTISTTSNGVDNDNNSFIANRIIRVRYGIVTRGTTTDNSLNAVITDNIIGPAAFGADQIGRTGILLQADTGATVSRNTVQFVGACLVSLTQICTTGSDRTGIGIGTDSWSTTSTTTITSGDYTVTRNIIHDVAEERTFSAAGVVLGTTRSGVATNNLVANNFIYNIRANGTSGDQLVGIGISGGNADRIVFNSISLTGDMDPGTAASSTNFGNGIRIPGANATNNANFTVVNNSIYVDVNTNVTTTHFYPITLNSATYSFGTGSLNYNNYYINPANPQLFTGGLASASGAAATTEFQTLANWRTALTPPQDANSIQADPLHISNTADLHIAAASPNVNAGTTVAGVNTDIDGQVRVGVPDIGADEPAGVTPPANDIAANSFIFPANGATVATGTAFAPQASFTNGGTATQTNVPVRFRVILQPAMIIVCNVTATIPAIDPGQTLTVTFPTCTLTVAGTYTIQATAELVGDQTPGNDSISGTITAVAPVSGTVNVGTGGAFTNLTNSDGIFAALNAAGASSNVTINITSDLTAETGTVALNQLAGGFTVTIKPSGAARIISGSGATGIIRLNDADGVTIDGSLTGGTAGNTVGGDATLRNLTVQNNSTGNGTVILIGSNTNGAQNNVVKNVNVIGNDPLTTFIGVQIGGAAVGAAGLDNDGNRVENCSFQKSTVGVYNAGASAANPNTGNVITKNEMAATAANRLQRGGILIFNQDGAQVTLNNIGGIEGALGVDHYGIAAGIQDVNTTAVTNGGIVNTTIARNRIDSVISTSTVGFTAFGIGIAGGTTGANTIANNMISSIVSPATSPDIVAGIFVAGVPSSTTRVYYNSVSMNLDRGTVASQIGSYSIAISGTDPTVELKNNAVMNNQTSGGGADAKSYAIGTASTTFVNLDSNYNDLYTLSANAGFFRSGGLGATATDYPNLAAWQAATARDANSLEVNPQFILPGNLHIVSNGPLVNIGIPIAAVTDDFDGQNRPATGVDIGADEIVAVVPGTLALSAATYTVAENAAGGTVTITVNRTGGTDGAVAVNYALTNGTATGGATCAAGVDYVNTGGTVSFANGVMTQTFTVAICNDTVFEGNETFNVTLSGATGGATIGSPSTAVVTIMDDEMAQPGMLQLSAATYSVGEAGPTATITVTRTGGTDGAVGATYALTNGTATGGATCAAGVDFVNTGGTVLFATGQASRTFTVAICNDTLLEGNETFNVTLSAPTGGATLGTPTTAVVTIIDDEVAQPGTLQFSSATYSVGEAGGTATVTVTRTGGTDGAVGATYALTNGTATGGATCAAGVDFVNTGGTVSFANGEASKTFTVAICNDTVLEGNEAFTVTLAGATGGATIGTPTTATITIVDDEVAQPGSLQLSAATYTVAENVAGGTVTVTVTRTGGTDGAVGATYALTDGTATGGATCAAGVDYVNTGGTVSFVNGEANKTFTVAICNDTVVEPSETFNVTLSGATGGATLGTPATAVVTITDDDVATGLSGNINVGAGQTYTSLTNAGGAFEALNTLGATGNVTFSITSDLTGETGAVGLNEVVGGFTVTIKPSGAARTISGTSAASSGVIILNGADNVTIDGSLSGGTDRSLTITNATTTSVVIWIRSVGTTNGATGNIIKNTNLAGSVAANIIAGIISGSSTFGGAATAANSNNTIQNNSVIKAQNAAFISGIATTFDQNWVVTGNTFGSTVASEKLSFRGMLIGNAQNFVISQNTILGVNSTSTSTSIMNGIQVATAVNGGLITRNNIGDIKQTNTGGFGAAGITLGQANTAANVTVANNFIRDVAGAGFAGVGANDNGYGITVSAGGGYKIYFNSINLATSQTAAGSITGALNITSAVTATGAIDLRDNILANTETIGTRFAVINSATTAAAVFTDINYNDYFAQNVGRQGTVAFPTLADWQGATGKDANSQAVDPLFVSATDLHLQPNSPVLDDGTPIAGITNDFDGDPRSATTPDIGADEIVGTAPQNGTLVLSASTYTVGEAAGTVTVTVNRTNGTDGAVSATYSLANGTATGGATCAAGVDFVNTGGTVNFAAGETTKTFTVTICNDTVVESSEIFTLTLAGATGGATIGTPATATVTITDDDVPAGPTLTINDVRVFEGDTGTVNAVFTVTASMTSTTAFTVNYATANNTATAGVDYAATSGTVTFAPGQTTQTITVQVIGDLLKEANETFFVNLSVPTGATIADPQGLGVIVDDDRAIVADFDNDGRTDLSVFRPSTGYWYSMPSSTGVLNFTLIGVNGDLPVPGDYDGDAKTDIAVFRPSNGNWYIQRSSDNVFVQTQWGLGTDKPVQGDFDGDGKTDLAVFRPSNGVWYVLVSSGGTFIVPFGTGGDVPVQGDYDGDAKTDFAVYRGGIWYVLNSSNNTVTAVNFGAATDKPLVGDFDGDGKADFTVYRAGIWYIFQTQTGTSRAVAFGASTDIPIVGDYDGDGTSDIAVFRPSNGVWYVLRSSDNGFAATAFGQNGDIPIPAGYQSLQ